MHALHCALSGLFFLTLEDKFICLLILFYKNVYLFNMCCELLHRCKRVSLPRSEDNSQEISSPLLHSGVRLVWKYPYWLSRLANP